MKNIALVYNKLIPSVRLCGYTQLSYLKQCGKIEFEAISRHKIASSHIANADAVLFIRGDSGVEAGIAKALRNAGKYLIYALDDDLLNIPDYISSSEFYRRPYVKQNILHIMKSCHCLLTTSPKLAEKYGEMFENVYLIEEPATMHVKRGSDGGRTIKIGFSGSIDREADIEALLLEPLKRIKNRFGSGVDIEFFGAGINVAKALGARHIPYTENYEDYVAKMAGLKWDLGLAPMPATEFHSWKHYNKFIEYGSFGIIPVCSDREPYKRIVRHRENGVLCEDSPDDWELKICELIESERQRERIRNNLIDQIERDFSVEAVVEAPWETQIIPRILGDSKKTMTNLYPALIAGSLLDIKNKVVAKLYQSL